MVASQTHLPNPGQTQGARVPQTHQTTSKRRKPGTGRDPWNASRDLQAAVLEKTQKLKQVGTCKTQVATCPRVLPKTRLFTIQTQIFHHPNDPKG